MHEWSRRACSLAAFAASLSAAACGPAPEDRFADLSGGSWGAAGGGAGGPAGAPAAGRCSDDGVACLQDVECCSGSCDAGQCGAACTSGAGVCRTRIAALARAALPTAGRHLLRRHLGGMPGAGLGVQLRRRLL